MAGVTGRLNRSTGLWAKPLLERLIQHEVARALRYSAPLTLVRVAIYAPERSDETALKTLNAMVANILNTHLRAVDMPGHYDGDYLIVLPNTDEAGAHIVAARLAHTVSVLQMPAGFELQPAVCIGLASLPGGAVAEPSALIAQTAVALDEARRRGAHAVVAVSQLNRS